MAKKKASSSGSAGPSKAKVCFKYFIIVVVALAIAYGLFVNRTYINNGVSSGTSYIKEKVLKEPKAENKKDTKAKPSVGYDKKDRAELDALVGE